MANLRAANVIICDTSAAFVEAIYIDSIRYIAGTGTPSATIKKASSSGTVLWETAATTEVTSAETEINCPQGVYVTVAGTGTKVYLYLK